MPLRSLSLICLVLIIPIIIFSQDIKSSIRGTTSTQAQPIGETYAIIVGVSKYKHITPLLYASKDALMFKNFLLSPAGGNVDSNNIRMLLDSEVTYGAITGGVFKWLANRNIKPGDRIFFYFSGHGDMYNDDEFFFPYDTDGKTGPKQYLVDGNIWLNDLKRRLNVYIVQHRKAEVIFVVDACRVKNDSLLRSEKSNENDPLGITSFYATRVGEVAYESNLVPGGQGLYTYYFVKGAIGEADLKPKNGIITLSELAAYVEDSVQQTANILFKGGEQLPIYCCKENDRKPLFAVNDSTFDDYKKSYSFMNSFLESKMTKQKGIYTTKNFSSRDYQSKSDSLLLDVYNKFTSSIKTKNLLGTNSALQRFNTLKKFWINDPITEEAELMLITELINYSQTYVHLYLLGLDMEYVKTKATSKDPNASFYKDLSLISSSNFVLAAQYLETAIELMGKTDNLAKSLYPKLWFLQARSHFDNPKLTALNTAIELAKKALRVDTGATHIYHLLAMLEIENKNYSNAEYYFKKAIEGQTEYSKEGVKLGFELFKLSKLQEASVFYRLHNVSDKQYAIAYNILARTSIDNKDMESAKKFLTLALSKDSSAEYLRNNVTVFYHSLAINASANGKLAEAESFYSIAAQNAPKILFDSVMLNLGSFYFEKLKSFEKARTCYTTVLAVNPNNIKALNDYAVMYYMEGRNSKNLSFLDTAITISQQVKQKTSRNSYYHDLATQRINKSKQAKEFIKMAQ